MWCLFSLIKFFQKRAQIKCLFIILLFAFLRLSFDHRYHLQLTLFSFPKVFSTLRCCWKVLLIFLDQDKKFKQTTVTHIRNKRRNSNMNLILELMMLWDKHRKQRKICLFQNHVGQVAYMKKILKKKYLNLKRRNKDKQMMKNRDKLLFKDYRKWLKR